MLNLSFYKGKRVLVTGHTGFKGTWLCKILINAGAIVCGYSLESPTVPNLFSLSKIEEKMTSVIGDIRDLKKLDLLFKEFCPEIVIHLAAQPIVRESYVHPVYTYDVNVMGTVNICECVRNTPSVKSFLNVTTDKVYLNDDIPNHPFKESEPLDGFDPYSNSKSCSELVTHSYKKSFFDKLPVSVSTARAGNVIGGGDFSKDRIIPDCVRAIETQSEIVVRNPHSIRPYQHVLEPLYIYLDICQKQFENKNYEGYYNIGPDDCDCVTTGELVTLFCEYWGNHLSWINQYDGGPHEASFLKLDNQKIKNTFQWHPRWHIRDTMKQIVEFTKIYLDKKEEIPFEMDREIALFMKGQCI